MGERALVAAGLSSDYEARRPMSERSRDSAPEVGAGPAHPATESDPATGWSLLAALLLAASLLAPLAAVGIWDPYELELADLGRRFALNFFGGEGLTLQDLSSAMPTRGELGRGELPITSVGLGFRLFGLYEWAGRLPLALWGLGGAAASYWLVARLADRTAAALTVIVLATTPLYFLHARTMLGDIVTMAAFAGACAGLGVATFDRGRSRLLQALGLLLGAAALAAGFLSRGVLLGVAAPALGVGLSWLVLRASGALSREALGDAAGALSLLVGSAAALIGVRLLSEQLAEPERYLWWLGFAARSAKKLPTFDSVLSQLGHALFPWSAVLPVAAARLFSGAGAEEKSPASERALGLRTLLLIAPAVAYLAYALVAPVAGVLPFPAVCCLAAVAALGLLGFDRGAPASRVAAMLTGALALILLVDFRNFPDKALSAFVLGDAALPESFREQGTLLLSVGTLAFAALFALCWLERADARRPVFAPEEYGGFLKTLRELWNGNFFFGLLALEAALFGFVAIDWLGQHLPALRRNVTIGGLSLTIASWGWVALPGLVLAPIAVMTARDTMRLYDRLCQRLPRLPGRGALSLLSAALLGMTLSLVYFPAFGAHVSPKQVFGAYRQLAGKDEAIALLGASSGGASYYAGRNVTSFVTPNEAFDWLVSSKARRWLVIKEADLAPLNARYRGLATPARNLPVLDASSSEVLLVSNRLASGERNQNPLADVVLEHAPTPQHPLDVRLGDELAVRGWDVTDSSGARVSSVRPGKVYRFVIHFEALGSVTGNWETFIHIDGFQRRFNGDHPALAGKYPLHLFRAGDHFADRYDFTLEPNFTPGDYHVYFGLFTGSRRMDVTQGRHDDNRIDAGLLRVE
jgi:4-amino-4-deoxy-L-arabinose transferase-like glycosyltransferase